MTEKTVAGVTVDSRFAKNRPLAGAFGKTKINFGNRIGMGKASWGVYEIA